MAEPSGPVNGQNRVVEGLVAADGTPGYKLGANPVTPTGSAYDALATVVTGPAGAAIPVSQPGLSGAILQSVTTVSTSAVALPATPLAGRATMLVQNVGATTIYLGTSTVTANTAATGGIQLLPGQSIPMALNAAVVLYAISSASGGLVCCFEAAA